MNRALEDAGTILVLLLVFGPVVWAGLLMTIDPAKCARLLDGLAEDLSRFQHRRQWQAPLRGPGLDSRGAQTMVRLAGLALAAFGLLHISGMVPSF